MCLAALKLALAVVAVGQKLKAAESLPVARPKKKKKDSKKFPLRISYVLQFPVHPSINQIIVNRWYVNRGLIMPFAYCGFWHPLTWYLATPVRSTFTRPERKRKRTTHFVPEIQVQCTIKRFWELWMPLMLMSISCTARKMSLLEWSLTAY